MSSEDGTQDNVAAVISRLTKGLTAEQQSYALLKQGRVYTEQEEYDSAIEVLNKAISLHVSGNNFIARAVCYEKIMNWEDAYFDYSFAIRLDPNAGLIYGHRGLCLAKMLKFDIALEDLSKACQLEPSHANYYNRASVHLDAQNYHLALKDMNHVLRNEENPPTGAIKQRCLYLKALIGLELGHYDAVIADMRGLLVANPNVGATRALLAKAFRLKGKPEAAESQISFAITVEPNNAENYIERATARITLGTFKSITDAVFDMDIAIRLLMRPVRKESKSVRRLSRQASDLMPTLYSMSSQEMGKGRHMPRKINPGAVEQVSSKFPSGGLLQPPAKVSAAFSSDKSARCALRSNGSAATTPSKSAQRPQTAGALNVRQNEKSQAPSPKMLAKALHSKPSKTDSTDGNTDDSEPSSRASSRQGSFSQLTPDGPRRPRIARTGSMNKRENLSELAGEKSISKRMQTVSRALCQRAETRLLLLEGESDANTRLIIIQKSLHDSIKAIELSPSGDDLKVTLASCLLHLHENEKAESVLTDILTRHPKSVRVLYRLALCYRGMRKFHQSVETLSTIIGLTTFNEDGIITFAPQYAKPDTAVPPAPDRTVGGPRSPSILFRNPNSPKRNKSVSIRTNSVFIGSPLASPSSSPGPTRNRKFFAAEVFTPASERSASMSDKETQIPKESFTQKDDTELNIFGGVLPEKVFELRGSLFMELKSYSLALQDFGKAIMLAPDCPYYHLMRAICQRELGWFELALGELDACEERQFSDMCTLQTARATVFRLLRDWEAARIALQSAIEFAPKVADNTRVGYLQAQLVVVWIECGRYTQAVDSAKAAMISIYVPSSRYLNSKVGLLKGASRRVSDVIKFAKLDQREVSCLKLEWITRYHHGLALYRLKKYEKFVETVGSCVSALADFAPDLLSMGIIHFFMGISLVFLERYKESINHLNLALSNTWSSAHDANQVLCLFARGKIYQILGDRHAALANFNEAIRLDPSNGHVLFRRAWLYKSAFHDFEAAGADFETVRRLKLGDPNFTVDYKHINHVQFVAVDSDPDITADFPTLSDLNKLGGVVGSFVDDY